MGLGLFRPSVPNTVGTVSSMKRATSVNGTYFVAPAFSSMDLVTAMSSFLVYSANSEAGIFLPVTASA